MPMHESKLTSWTSVDASYSVLGTKIPSSNLFFFLEGYLKTKLYAHSPWTIDKIKAMICTENERLMEKELITFNFASLG